MWAHELFAGAAHGLRTAVCADRPNGCELTPPHITTDTHACLRVSARARGGACRRAYVGAHASGRGYGAHNGR